MGEPASESIVGKRGSISALRESLQAIGGIVGIGVHAIIEQVAFVVPGVIYAIQAGQAVGFAK